LTKSSCHRRYERTFRPNMLLAAQPRMPAPVPCTADPTLLGPDPARGAPCDARLADRYAMPCTVNV